MESSANEDRQSVEDFPPVSVSNLIIQSPQSGLIPLSPQLCYSQIRKQPPRTVSSSSSSRSLPPPATASVPPKSIESISSGSYSRIPEAWFSRCSDNKLLNRVSYMSRNKLLKKMIHQSLLVRPVLHNTPSNVDFDELSSTGALIVGSAIDYWLTIPIINPIDIQNQEISDLEGVSIDDDEAISQAYAIGPLNLSRYSLNRLTLFGLEQNDGDIKFPWVKNTSSTKILGLENIQKLEIEDINGFVECPICGENWFINYPIPERFQEVIIHLNSIKGEIRKRGETLLKKSHFDCKCNGEANWVKPIIIDDDLNKINWLFLYLGFGLGFCEINQLKYYCLQRKLPVSDNKNELLHHVFHDLSAQICNISCS